jgi:hypothetical protein
LPYFKDAQEVYDHLGTLIADATSDEELGPRFRRANTILRYEYSEPDSTITVRLQEGEPGDLDFGDSEMEPEVTVAMAADVAHRFWLGEVDLTVAVTKGQIKARGPVDKVIELVPLARPVVPRYRRQLIDRGREDLIET